MFDVEAAFLNSKLSQPIYIEWPQGMVELGFITQEEKENTVACCPMAMYVNVEAPRCWMTTFRDTLIGPTIGLTQSEADPCIFFKKDLDGNTILLLALFVDDTLVTGKKEEVKKFYTQIQKHYKIDILGKLKKHLGIWWDWKTDEKGQTALEASMPKMEQEICEAFKEATGKEAKEFLTPGYPGKTLSKHQEEPQQLDEYRSIVGKLLYYMTKVGPDMSNACQELASHLSSPGPEHWKALERAVGYIKTREGIGMRFTRPKSDQLISFVDSNYATDPDDRKSISGRINTLGGTILNWSSKKQQTVTLSSTEAEYVALAECGQEVKFEHMLLKEILGIDKPAKI